MYVDLFGSSLRPGPQYGVGSDVQFSSSNLVQSFSYQSFALPAAVASPAPGVPLVLVKTKPSADVHLSGNGGQKSFFLSGSSGTLTVKESEAGSRRVNQPVQYPPSSYKLPSYESTTPFVRLPPVTAMPRHSANSYIVAEESMHKPSIAMTPPAPSPPPLNPFLTRVTMKSVMPTSDSAAPSPNSLLPSNPFLKKVEMMTTPKSVQLPVYEKQTFRPQVPSPTPNPFLHTTKAAKTTSGPTVFKLGGNNLMVKSTSGARTPSPVKKSPTVVTYVGQQHQIKSYDPRKGVGTTGTGLNGVVVSSKNNGLSAAKPTSFVTPLPGMNVVLDLGGPTPNSIASPTTKPPAITFPDGKGIEGATATAPSTINDASVASDRSAGSTSISYQVRNFGTSCQL